MPTMAEMLKKEANKVLDSNKLTDVVYGKVSSIDPLKINIDSRFEIDGSFLYVTPQCRDMVILVDDIVTMIRYKKGQLYFVIEVNGEISSGGGTGPGLPDGGVAGDIIIKNSNVDGDADWATPPYEPKKASTDLYVTSGEKSTWNAKQNALVEDTDYLTPGTASSTYEPKKGSDDNFVTDAEKIKLSNLSGVNTGDQDLSSFVTFLQVYPIGSIYMSVNSANPSTLFGGTWSAWGTGRVPVGVDTNDEDFSTVEKTGGASTVTLDASTMPAHTHDGTTASKGAHTHNAQGFWRGSGNTSQDRVLSYVKTSDKANNEYGTTSILSAGAHTHTFTTSEVGGGEAHENKMKYITCYMWKRVS